MSSRRKKAELLRRSARKGKLAEVMTEAKAALSGFRLKRTGIGHDYEARPMFGAGKPFYVEVKSGSARLSKRQREAKARLGKRYIVHRTEPDFGLERAAKRAKKFLEL